MSDPNVAVFWKEVEHQRELMNQIEITRVSRMYYCIGVGCKKITVFDSDTMLQSARVTTDGVVNAIKTTNEIHNHNLLSLLPAGYSPKVNRVFLVRVYFVVRFFIRIYSFVGLLYVFLFYNLQI
jgi:hypothetical protein